jgi:hypothetical protein
VIVGQAEQMRNDGRADLVWSVLAGFALLALVLVGIIGAGGLVFIAAQGSLGCELQATDSNYGRRSWSAVPPGPVCTYTTEVNGVDTVDGPSPVTSLWLLTLLMLAIAFVFSLRRALHARALLHSG